MDAYYTLQLFYYSNAKREIERCFMIDPDLVQS